jgi:aryl-alcohol dehydrogenase-like predicted oxidoreductase
MNPLTRREFLKASAIGAAALVTTSAGGRSETVPATPKSAADRVKLGKTGLVASRLAQGTGVHGGNQQSDHTRMGQEAFTRLIRHGFDKGLNFWDMADLYGTHTMMRKAMEGIDREKYVVLSKIWTRPEKWNDLTGGATAAVDRFCKELNTDALDICLIHCMTDKDWTEREKRSRDELSELKQKGKVRALGVSCHSHDALKTAVAHPWVDVVLARINHMGGAKYKMDGTVAEITETLKLARANGKTVIGMKIFGEGTLIKPEEKDASLKFVLNSGIVDAITIGMSKIEEVDDCFVRIAKALSA